MKYFFFFLITLLIPCNSCSNTEPILKIGLVADPQYADKPRAGTRYYSESLWKLDEAIDSFNFYGVDFVQNLGDLIDSDWESYDAILPIYEKLHPHIETHHLLGNHDYEIDSAQLKDLQHKLSMPDYYYSYSEKGWRFIVLDATDYSYFSNPLHDRDVRQIDSYFENTREKANHYTWNGAIGKEQLLWLKQQLDSAELESQKVILFSHLPVRPQNDPHNLWNDEEVTALIENSSSVVAFVNGHNHAGGYAFENGIHHITIKGMVENRISSYAILEIYEDHMVLKGFGDQETMHLSLGRKEAHNLVPEKAGPAPNYWCTWYWQNYLIKKGQEVRDPDAGTVYSNPAARDQLTEETTFGEEGMAVIMLPRTRSDYYFLIDHGWQDKSIEEQTFFTGILDTLDFPRYAGLEPRERLKQMNLDIQALGWRGLALWFRGNPGRAHMQMLVEWSRYAGIEYWKIDGGDTEHFYATQLKADIYPQLRLEHISGAGPVNPKWQEAGLDQYPSVYVNDEAKKQASLNIIKNTDVFRTYDAAPLLVSTTSMQRVHDLLELTAGKPEYRALLNIQDDCNVAAALGLVVAVKRHPMNTPRLYAGQDFHLQIAGDRHVDRRLNEMDRLARWQRIAPPMPAGYGDYRHSEDYLIDSIVFEVNHTWFRPTHGEMVRQSAPALMARNIALPEVFIGGISPYVMASKFPNGAIAIATEGRVRPEQSWIEPLADVSLEEVTANTPIGIFGYYKSLTLKLGGELPGKVSVLAQDLLSTSAMDITDRVKIKKKEIWIPGQLIEEIGTMENDEEDISAPGLVMKITLRP